VKCQSIGEEGKLENYQVVFVAGPEHVSTTIPSGFFIIQVMKIIQQPVLVVVQYI
jgi:hypothetical protein